MFLNYWFLHCFTQVQEENKLLKFTKFRLNYKIPSATVSELEFAFCLLFCRKCVIKEQPFAIVPTPVSNKMRILNH